MTLTYAVGEDVEVHAFGSWYLGQVVKSTPRRATVRFTSGTGVTRDKAVSLAGDPSLVKVRRPGEARRIHTRGAGRRDYDVDWATVEAARRAGDTRPADTITREAYAAYLTKRELREGG